jgi:hypothetical protein
VPPSPAEWAQVANTVLVATLVAYAMTHRPGFDRLDAEAGADIAAAFENANAFYCAMARVTVIAPNSSRPSAGPSRPSHSN